MEQELKGQTKETNEIEKPARPQSTIISANGVKIESKLNPAAKEFYPAHLMQRYGSNRPPEVVGQMQNKASSDNVGRVDVPESKGFPKDIVNTALDTQDDKPQIEEAQIEKQIEAAEILVDTAKAIEVTGREDNDNEEQTVTESKAEKLTEYSTEIENTETMFKVNSGMEISMKVEQDISGKIEGKPTNNSDERVSISEDQEDISETNIQLNINGSGYGNKTVQGNKEIPDEITNVQESLRQPQHGDAIIANIGKEVTVESVGDIGDVGITVDTAEIASTGDLEEILDAGDNGRQKSENDANLIIYINNISHSQTHFDLNSEYQVPPTTPTNELSADTEKARETFEKSELQHSSNDKSQLERKLGMSKISKIAVGASSKPTTTNLMARTKRISESLHNLSTALKSKADIKKSDAGARLLPRSSTTIPRSTVRSRKTTTKSTTACNGLSEEVTKLPVKDAISLRSTSSTDKSITSNSSHLLHSKASPKSTKTTDKLPNTLAQKPKETTVAHILPRGTLASTLRQSEAQKRRNLFPNDDPESNTNIELSQFLFK